VLEPAVVPITNVLRLRYWPDRAHFAGVSRTMASAVGLCEQLYLDSDYLGRQLDDLGYEVRLIAPKYVRPYVKSQKNDGRDTEAAIRFVSLKSESQLDLQSLHRVRERLVQRRTALINQIRGLLLERGLSVPRGKGHLIRGRTSWFERRAAGPEADALLHIGDQALR
jgi:transposase